MKTKVVTFDFWNTIFDSSDAYNRNAERINALISGFRECGLRGEVNGTILYNDIFEHFNQIWIEKSRTITARDMVTFAFDSFKLSPDAALVDQITEVFQTAVLYNPPKLNENIREAFETLEKNFHLAIVSDTGFSPGKTLRSLLNTESVLHFFSAFSFSDETGVSKPSREAFEPIFNKFGVTPEECIHIGDNARTDITGAKRLGMRAIHYIGDPSNLQLNKEQVSEFPADFTSSSWPEITNWIQKNA